jgi:transcriptional regulator with XRE-family HTH domain
VTWMQELGARIREARKARGLSQANLAERVEVSRATIVHYEKGQVNQPLLEVVTRIAVALETSFQVSGCAVGNERALPEAVAPEQFCLPLDEEHTFANAVIKISPKRDRLTILAEIPA